MSWEVVSVAYGGPRGQVDERAASMLEALFTQSPVGLHLLDTDLRVVRVNTATPAMQIVSLDEVIGRPVGEVYGLIRGEGFGDEGVEAALRTVLDTGVPLRNRVIRVRIEADPMRVRHFEVTVLRLEDPQGTVIGLAVTSVDVSERERNRARAEVLDTVRRTVGRTLDAAVTGEELVDALVPAFADVAIVEVVEAVIRGDEPPLAPLHGDTPLMRTAFRSDISRPPTAHPVGDVRRLPGPTAFTQALADLRPRVVELQPDAPWFHVDPPRAEAIRSSRAHTLLAAPLALRDAVVGLVSLYRTGQTPPFDEDDRRLAVELAAHTALCVDNARRFTREHTVAATIQRQLLPRTPETHASLDTAFLSVTGADPGAWYDTIALSGARTALVVGHVSGRGLNAAATMGQLRTVIRSLAAFDLAPDELLARLHDTTAQLAAERANLPLGDPLRRETLTADCVYAIHNPLTGTCLMAGAGRPAALVVRPDRTVGIPDPPSGPRLGTDEDTPYGSVEFAVPEGSVLVFTSDPLLTSYLAECPGPLRSAPQYAERPLQDLCDAIVYALPPGLRAGDAAVIVARVRTLPSDRVAAWRLDPDPASVALARHRVRAQLTAWNVDEETAFNTELIVSELVTNAIRYGDPPLELRLINDRGLTCEVRDGGAAAPHLRHARTVDEGGRGLFIAAQLAHAWGTRYSDQGKTIWTEQPMPPSQGGR
ncbi:SpoIIE family protein phosphatase [Streptomyces sp. NPDC086549]|uniref:SpoIIE family protein phosphatase n=1 Tax=Streptomyces sp. NPDC086549 TaxID=3365752 RepID=UPI0037F93C20